MGLEQCGTTTTSQPKKFAQNRRGVEFQQTGAPLQKLTQVVPRASDVNNVALDLRVGRAQLTIFGALVRLRRLEDIAERATEPPRKLQLACST